MPRVPSEALPLCRALPSDKLLSGEKLSGGASIGLRDFHGQQRLVIKLARRKNARSGFTAFRPCFCEENSLLPKHNCPIHMFWVSILDRAAPGDMLFPALRNKNINRVLRAAFNNIGVPDAEKFSSHCFRRGAATAILNSGSTLSEIMRTAGWSSKAFRIYLDIQKAEEASTKAVLAPDISESSDCVSSETSTATSTPPPTQRKNDISPLPFLPRHWV